MRIGVDPAKIFDADNQAGRGMSAM